MLALLEGTWPVWWILAILVLLRWFHINSLSHDYSEGHNGPPAVPSTSRGTSPLFRHSQ